MLDYLHALLPPWLAGLDDTFNEVSDISILGEDVYKALSTPSAPVVIVDGAGPFPLLFWEVPPVSWDLRDRLNDSLTPADIAAVAGRIEAVYANDLRFDALRATVDYDGATRKLTADIEAQASGQLLQLRLVADSNNILVEPVT